ncbi:MAG TPA: HEAT repeat domain-containing protein [Isosphaeraceae bacterium]|nr:HEAT repeat domain-containing protein [Isosphaeraceae bacterium]
MKVAAGASAARADEGRFRPRVNLKTMIALVACCGAVFWAWRVVLQSKPINRMVFALRSGTAEDRRVAARELGTATAPEVHQAIPALIVALGDADDEVAAQAARSLGTAGATAATAPDLGALIIAATEALSRALSEDRPEVRLAAVHSLGLLGSRAGVAPPDALVRMLQGHPSEEFRGDAATALGQFHTTNQGAIRALLDALVDDAIPVRRACNTALRQQSLVPPLELVPLLIQSLRQGRDARERYLAASLLGRRGPAAQEAVPALVATLQEPPGARPVSLTLPPPTGRFAGRRPTAEPEEAPRDWDPACEAALALGLIAKGTVSSGQAVAALKRALRSEYLWRRGAAARGLRAMGSEARAAVPDLAVALTEAVTGKQEPGNGESWIVLALGELAPGSASAPQAIRALIAALDAKQGGIRGWAADSLGQFGPNASAAIPRLRTLLDDSDAFVATKAKAAMASIEGKTGPSQAAARTSGRRPSDPARN